MPMRMRCCSIPRMNCCRKLSVIDRSYTSKVGWKWRPLSSARVVPLVMKTRSHASVGKQLSVKSLKASIGTAGISCHCLTVLATPPATPLRHAEADLVRKLLAFIAQADSTEAEFNAMALALFAHQVKHNIAFQRFCLQRGKTLRTVKQWQDIPAVPIDAFKD